MSEETLRSYGMAQVGTVRLIENKFVIDIMDQALADADYCIYAFVIGDEIVRIGSSKGQLRSRFRAWQRDVSQSLNGHHKPTPGWEAQAWKAALEKHGSGKIFARRGADVTTPIGTFPAYLDEESVLIGRHLPRLNRSKHR